MTDLLEEQARKRNPSQIAIDGIAQKRIEYLTEMLPDISDKEIKESIKEISEVVANELLNPILRPILLKDIEHLNKTLSDRIARKLIN